MKKDIEWLKKEIATEMIELEPNRKERWSDVKYQTLRNVAQKIYQLDELEVLSQAWIDEHLFSLGDKYPWKEAVPVVDLQNLLVPKQELPVIPQWVADNIESKKRIGTRLNVAMSEFPESRLEKELDIDEHECNEIYARAWLDGYETEEEPIYYALIKGHELSSGESKYWNCEAYTLGHLFVGQKDPKTRCINRMTKNNWGIFSINDSNADFVEVQE